MGLYLRCLKTKYPDLAGAWLRRQAQLGRWTSYRYDGRRFLAVTVQPPRRWLIRLAAWWWQVPVEQRVPRLAPRHAPAGGAS